jgi:hypothetical protein
MFVVLTAMDHRRIDGDAKENVSGKILTMVFVKCGKDNWSADVTIENILFLKIVFCKTSPYRWMFQQK